VASQAEFVGIDDARRIVADRCSSRRSAEPGISARIRAELFDFGQRASALAREILLA
jgi:hypothetical protein